MWFLILAILAALIYVNQVGLPGFLKKPLLEELRGRGIDLQFSRLRLRWYQGIVAEKVHFGQTEHPLGPQLTVSEIQMHLNRHALGRLKLQVDGLMLRRGRLVWPVTDTNQPARELAVENIQTELRLLPNDQWELDHFTAEFAGAKIRLSGAVTNASVVRNWEFLRAKRPAPFGLWQDRLRKLAHALEATHFSAPPELVLDMRGDARDIQSFHARLGLTTPGAETPWGAVTQGRFTARILPATNDLVSRAELTLQAADAQTPWATGTNLQVFVHVTSFPGQTNLVNASLAVSASQADTKWGSGTNIQFTANWVHSLTNAIPLSGTVHLHSESAETQWGRAGRFEIGCHLATPEVQNSTVSSAVSSSSSPIWSWWTNLAPYALDWELQVAELESPKIQADQIACSGHWAQPELTITNLRACVFQGQIDANAALNVITRSAGIHLTTDVDPKQVSPLLTETARRWLAQYSWHKAPSVAATISLVLPEWTNGAPDWRTEVQPTLSLQGQFNAEHGGAFRGVPVLSAQSHFSYTNMAWRLPDLTVVGAEGRIQALHESSNATKDFYWRVAGAVDPKAFRPLLETNQQRALDLFTFTQPPVIAAEVWGHFNEPERIGFKGRVGLTNFTFRGEAATGFQTAFEYTNRFLQLTDARAQLGTQQLSAASVGADFRSDKIYLTNGFSTADPTVVTRAIGPKIAHTMEPYHFSRPPAAHVHGIIPMHKEEDADLHFAISGGPFQWWKLDVKNVSADVHWVGQRLTLSDIRSDFFTGFAAGSAGFNFAPKQGADFQFTVVATNANLHLLATALSGRSNNLEGHLSGSLVITNANSIQRQKLDGYGNLELHDGLIWDIPIFGIFSPVLNSITPGLGNSRATGGTCSFVISNGVMRSNDLEIRAPALRLAYRGALDIPAEQVNARVDAELLRDVWGVGPVISTVLSPFTKMFEYKITGPVAKPKTEPVYVIPKIVQMPFLPFRGLKELLLEDTHAAPTNAPLLLQQTR